MTQACDVQALWNSMEGTNEEPEVYFKMPCGCMIFLHEVYMDDRVFHAAMLLYKAAGSPSSVEGYSGAADILRGDGSGISSMKSTRMTGTIFHAVMWLNSAL